jgi:nucleotide-binding universal stress UspA family protein
MARPEPIEYRRVVVAVGDPDGSMHATAIAAHVVDARGELVLVHVVEVPLELPIEDDHLPEEEPVLRRAHELLAAGQAIADRYGVPSRRVLERRHAPGPAVVEVAERVGASLIAIAAEQRFSRAGRLRLGSTATHVLRHAACPVMIISAGLPRALNRAA